MNANQKEAWFNIIVVCGSLLIVAALMPVLGKPALGGMGFLGFLGFSPLFFRQRGGVVAVDERDAQIRLRSQLCAHAVTWLLFIVAALAAPGLYGWDGSVPVQVVMASVWCGMVVLYLVSSLATLIQYGTGGRNAVEC